jgi:hypothetical protein
MIETIAVIVALSLVIVAGRVLGAGSEAIIAELFPPHRQPEWPRGVQEEDAPQFVFSRTV